MKSANRRVLRYMRSLCRNATLVSAFGLSSTWPIGAVAQEVQSTMTSVSVDPARENERRPNVIIWLLDDVGFAQLGCYGGLIDTPNIDRMASKGLRFSNFNSTSLCSPSRAALLTGRNHHAVGFGSHANRATDELGYNVRIPPNATGLARILGDQGYATFTAGKWDTLRREEASIAGPFDQWPSGQGFQHSYSFLSAEASHFHPKLWSDHNPTDPSEGRKNYFLTTDLADKAVNWITGLRSVDPKKPFFLYWATGAVHAPHHAPESEIRKYRGRFDMGWDRAREEILARQIASGLVPKGTLLPPRPRQLPAWDSLTAIEKKNASRQMEVFAAQLSQADAQFGRILETIERTGDFNNTVVIVTSDNGASAEGGPYGTYNEFREIAGFGADEALNIKMTDEWGSAATYPNYSAAWAFAGNTPFRFWKQTTYSGGVRVPMVISVPDGILDPGSIRSQFIHITDIVPTILTLTRVLAPDVVDGVYQKRFDGVDFNKILADSDWSSPKSVQYFEMFGNRGLWSNGWKVVSPANNWTWDPGARKKGKYGAWELYNLNRDFNEQNDVAKDNPEKLKQMISLFEQEAIKNHVYPLNPNFLEYYRAFVDRNVEGRGAIFRMYPPGGGRIPYLLSAPLNKDMSISTKIDIRKDQKVSGVIVSAGGVGSGISLYVKENVVYFAINYLGEAEYRVMSRVPLREGSNLIKVSIKPSSHGEAVIDLFLDGDLVGKKDVRFPPYDTFGLNETFDIGKDGGEPVSSDYIAPFEFNGLLEYVDFDVLP
jgi:arylsulfatase A-like enzyme